MIYNKAEYDLTALARGDIEAALAFPRGIR